MAFDPFLIEILSEKYEWLIGEDEWYKLTVPRWTENDLRRVWHVWGSSGKKMRMLFRHREASRLLWKLGENDPRRRMREILDLFAISREDVCLLLAMDAEVWGLYGGDNLQNLTWFLEEAEKRKIEICLINEIMDKMSPKEGPETILFFPAYTWAHVEEEYGLESRENCTYYNWTHNDREKILQSLVDSARIEIKKAEATGADAEEAWKSLLAAEASDWSGWQHIPFRSLLGRELACRAYKLAKKAQEAGKTGESRENAAEKRRK
jgi:alpha-amylase/alpha-mannosidase (GH57 family)